MLGMICNNVDFDVTAVRDMQSKIGKAANIYMTG